MVQEGAKPMKYRPPPKRPSGVSLQEPTSPVSSGKGRRASRNFAMINTLRVSNVSVVSVV